MINFTIQEKKAEKIINRHKQKMLKKQFGKRKTTLIRIKVDLRDKIKIEAKLRKMCAVRVLDEIVEDFFKC